MDQKLKFEIPSHELLMSFGFRIAQPGGWYLPSSNSAHGTTCYKIFVIIIARRMKFSDF